VSFGSFIAGNLVNDYGGSFTFRLFSFGAFTLFLLHVLIQWTLTRKGERSPGKKSTAESAVNNNADALQATNNNGLVDDDGFKEIDLAR